MSTQTRLLLLFCVLLSAFAATVWLHHRSHVKEAEAMIENMAAERGELLDRILELNGLGLRNFAYDYSYWDELVAFVEDPKPDWAKVNLDESLRTFDLHGVWILRPEGEVLYSVERGGAPSLKGVPTDKRGIIRKIESDRFAHFFLSTPSGVFEFRSAPIQPSADAARTTAPRGWLVASRRWDDKYLADLGKTLRSEITVQAADQDFTKRDTDKVSLTRELKDHNGRTVASLHAKYLPEPIELLKDENRGEQALFLAFGAVILVGTLVGVGRWVIVPLRNLERSLAGSSPKALEQLSQKHDEFGRLARLVSASFEQRSQLEREVEERRRMEAALRRSEDEVRSSADLKNRLARDLHDGVIQSLYAAGLGLEGVRGLMRDDPTSAQQRIEAVQQALNQTIRDVRGFINGLEPEAHTNVPFDQALRTLVGTLQALHGVRIDLDLPPGESPALTPAEEVHALQIVRESVSNALRHAQPKRVAVSFRKTAAGRMLVITDDGRGFDAEEVERRGHSGLANLAARAREIGGALTVESALGKGTRVILSFAQSGRA
jgi:signal transduction histidine kinase